MTLRLKTALLIMLTFALLFTGMIVTAYRVLNEGFLRIEEDFSFQSSQRLHAGIESLEDVLRSLSGDWAHWDDTYDFVLTADPSYVEENLTALSLANLNLNLVVILDTEGSIVFGTGFDLEEQAKMDLPSGIQRYIESGDPLVTHDPDDPDSCHTGFLAMDENVAIVASRPILDNHMEGPSRGVLIFGFYLDHVLVGRLESALRHPLHFQPVQETTLDPFHQDVLRRLTRKNLSHVSDFTPDHLQGYTLINDIEGEPALLARYTLPRDIYREGRRSVQILATWMLLSGIAFGLVVFAVLHRFVLSRIARIAHGAEAIRKNPGMAASIETEGRDEIAALGHSLNGMLDAIRDSHLRLASEKEQLSVTLRSIGDGVIATDAEGRIRLMNRVAEWFIGRTEADAAGQLLSDAVNLFDERTRDLLANPVAPFLEAPASAAPSRQVILVPHSGEERLIELRGAAVLDEAGRPTGVVLVFRDITESRRIAEDRLQANKLESLGVLAGGIAHDFNNILTAITANISMARINMEQTDEFEEYLASAEQAAMDATGLTHQLLTFAKGGEPVKRLMNLHELIRESATLAARGRPAKCECDIADSLWPAHVDDGQIRQVLHNLVINAADAMPTGGVIRVSAHNAERGHSPADTPTICISVEDQGTGIPDAHRDRIFDPYFTTKQKGSGLGLATTYSIVRKHDGYIQLQSTSGKGSRFEVYLPAAPDESPAHTGRSDKIVRGTGRILVVDDQADILKVVSSVLKRAGYTTTTTEEGSEAVNEYLDAYHSGQPFDAVLMDLTIPGGMGGLETLAKMRDIDPDVRAIVASGYSNDPVLADFKRHGFRAALVKPFGSAELSAIVRQVIDSTE